MDYEANVMNELQEYTSQKKNLTSEQIGRGLINHRVWDEFAIYPIKFRKSIF